MYVLKGISTNVDVSFYLLGISKKKTQTDLTADGCLMHYPLCAEDARPP